jgi:hypothetical protein
VNLEDPRERSDGLSHLGDDNDNDYHEAAEEIHCTMKGTGKGKWTKNRKGNGKATDDGKGKRKRKEKGNGKRKGIVKQSTGGDDNSPAVALQLQKEM